MCSNGVAPGGHVSTCVNSLGHGDNKNQRQFKSILADLLIAQLHVVAAVKLVTVLQAALGGFAGGPWRGVVLPLLHIAYC